MSAASTRTSRRVATRRNAVVDSDDEDDLTSSTVTAGDDAEDDFAPEPAATRTRPTRSGRKSTAPAAAPVAAKGRGRPKKSIAPTPAPEPEPEPVLESAPEPEPSDDLDADATVQTVLQSPAKTPSPRKRKSVAPRASMVSTADLAPPTPKASRSPDASLVPATPQSMVPATPLSDITTSSVNTHMFDDTQATIKPIRPMDTIMDNPIDIVLKSRTVTIPAVEDIAPKSRIVLTYLILNNFKSYAGRQEVGPFHASFSSVVGPNGSGKSNVIDSLLFVFGFRASKMRQGKISALIHNSAQHPNLEFCEVAVHFQEVMDQVCWLQALMEPH